MGNTILPGYGANGYGSIRAGRTKPSGAHAASFPGMARESTKAGAAALPAGGKSSMDTAVLSARLTAELAARSAGAAQAEGAGKAEAAEIPSLEGMLKAKYPGITYHVFDASSSYWRSRNDYPHYLLYREGDEAKETLENWQPEGANPFYGSKDGRFIAPKEIHELGNVPPGSKAVVIHPAVQARMDKDPAYAKEIMAKIDTWFAFDVARNEAIMPGSTIGMSQAVAIGEDGNICNACSSSSGGTITRSSDEMVRAYRSRMAKRADFMRWLAEEHREDAIRENQLLAAAEAKSRLTGLMGGGNLLEILGDEIAGVPTRTVLSLAQAQIWGGRTIL